MVDILCRHPRKYLRCLGWFILAVEAHAAKASPAKLEEKASFQAVDNSSSLPPPSPPSPLPSSRDTSHPSLSPCLFSIAAIASDIAFPLLRPLRRRRCLRSCHCHHRSLPLAAATTIAC
ncbi:hypothetical protein BGW80DRAFT_1294174 [Lactifluus volemus]|nr:hypothetical protein BGW80DRAFT_1294174 [Lactifluus volemus]